MASHRRTGAHALVPRRRRGCIDHGGAVPVAAGVCALAGAWFANNVIKDEYHADDIATMTNGNESLSLNDWLNNELVRIAATTFIAAFVLSFIFTFWRSKRTNTPVWGAQARRLMINVAIPMVVGGIFLFALMQNKIYGFIAPGCLIFYGLALLNASKYTLYEIRYLSMSEILLGIINLWFIGYGIYFWALGFGVLHIIYGTVMWWKYER